MFGRKKTESKSNFTVDDENEEDGNKIIILIFND